MRIHPKIKIYMDLLSDLRAEDFKERDLEILGILNNAGTTSTEAIIALHFALNIEMEVAEKVVYASNLWKPEHIQDIAYQTMLYMSDYDLNH
ncbi:hypothetical protein [Ferruginibacter sp. HRS2-29]|uniref:hypothetical protein n=1 Tax=Ferruginibacter sp. HRS2-29 TaxID=2487334 RepID=UPI0020CE4D0B|nr:hypothetical protein [Ferruginibacter sp. HRS2-29]MCP9750052.1 hypothetical protein [Ferruginibacter sp. HRS2-29]